MMTTHCSLFHHFVFVALLAAGCRPPSEMLQFADKCEPGGDYLACQQVTFGHTVSADGELFNIRVEHVGDFYVPSDPKAFGKLTSDGRAALSAFEHTMMIEGSDERTKSLIVQILDAEIGSHEHGDPFAQYGSGSRFDKTGSDYWSTPEGTWAITSSGMTSWYSAPTGEPADGIQHPEQYVKPAPESARIWRKLARVLTHR